MDTKTSKTRSLAEGKAGPTPGPWRVAVIPGRGKSRSAGLGCDGALGVMAGEQEICHSRFMQEPNARLIAASPRLLEACRAVLLDWSTRPVGGPAVMLGTIERLEAAVRE